MQVTETLNEMSDDELHSKANQCISESNQLLFKQLPALISQIIEQDVWRKRNTSYKNFGEYALNQSPDGLGIANNELLWLLRSAMSINTHHASHWGDVLGEVDTSARMYAKEKKIPIKDLHKDLSEQEPVNPEYAQEEAITYLPSRSRSVDGVLMKLKMKDPLAYQNVIQGKVTLKEALPQNPRKKLQPIESVKNKFSSLSKSDREAFLAWIEEEREHLM
ncbi:hypothetical protein [uncultured Legionella sp.]|uniref:hypothetical protein n=1 Tax=uncultured Legionella sp. TaxID=210934 RepID=UPI0026102AEE|nr:hypothetical protein [uncultured Legionella sp.]